MSSSQRSIGTSTESRGIGGEREGLNPAREDICPRSGAISDMRIVSWCHQTKNKELLSGDSGTWSIDWAGIWQFLIGTWYDRNESWFTCRYVTWYDRGSSKR